MYDPRVQFGVVGVVGVPCLVCSIRRRQLYVLMTSPTGLFVVRQEGQSTAVCADSLLVLVQTDFKFDMTQAHNSSSSSSSGLS